MPFRSVFRQTGAALLALALGAPLAHAGETETVLYDFHAKKDGAFPMAGLVKDSVGNFYGTSADGLHTFGTVFELSPNGSGGWNFKVIYTFQNGLDGAIPTCQLALDSHGNLYGTSETGGSYSQGAVFELSQHKDGTWFLSNAYDFIGTSDGGHPQAGVVLDAAGNIYGTTSESSDSSNAGTVFQVKPTKRSGWVEKTLHAFRDGRDGGFPHSGVILDANGDVYGTVPYGDDKAPVGLVYRLHNDGKRWHDTVLYDFKDGEVGGIPQGGVIFDAVGNLYGTTSLSAGFVYGGGVFELSPPVGDAKHWRAKSLIQFANSADGYYPQTSLVFDKTGNLYGVTPEGGKQTCQYGCGVIYKLSPTQSGPWDEHVLRRFNDHRLGAGPTGPLVIGQDGAIYGTAGGGAKGAGIVYSLAKSP